MDYTESFCEKFYRFIIKIGESLQSLILLFVRLFWGLQFLFAGWGKFIDINTAAGFFEKLNIPVPTFSAYLTATFEVLGGLALVLGLGTRLFSIPLIVIMLTALFTAHKGFIANFWVNPFGILEQTPFTFLMAALILWAFGPGKFSIDALLKRYWYNDQYENLDLK